jgi:hypothetical protein
MDTIIKLLMNILSQQERNFLDLSKILRNISIRKMRQEMGLNIALLLLALLLYK